MILQKRKCLNLDTCARWQALKYEPVGEVFAVTIESYDIGEHGRFSVIASKASGGGSYSIVGEAGVHVGLPIHVFESIYRKHHPTFLEAIRAKKAKR